MNLVDRKIPLILFAKTPVIGKVKTRLQPQCSATQAFDIAKILLEESIIKVVNNWPGEVILSVWPDMNDEFIQYLLHNYPIDLVRQSSGDLGEKMLSGFQEAAYPAAIMGCDAPHITKKSLSECHDRLLANENVIGPSEDGGYYLIGLSEPRIELFTNIEWGSDQVFADSLATAKRQSLKFKQLPIMNDVDIWQDVIDVAHSLPKIESYLKSQNLI